MINIGPDSNPLMIFDAWLADAKANSHIKEATAMTLATAGGGALHARIVLCKK